MKWNNYHASAVHRAAQFTVGMSSGDAEALCLELNTGRDPANDAVCFYNGELIFVVKPGANTLAAQPGNWIVLHPDRARWASMPTPTSASGSCAGYISNSTRSSPAHRKLGGGLPSGAAAPFLCRGNLLVECRASLDLQNPPGRLQAGPAHHRSRRSPCPDEGPRAR